MESVKLKIIIDPESPVALYRQIAGELRKQINEGTIDKGTFLPGERTLAKQLSVNRDVVRRAYIVLKDEKLVKPWKHLGYRVNRGAKSEEA